MLSDDEVAAVIGTPVTRREASTKTAGSFGCVKGNDRAGERALYQPAQGFVFILKDGTVVSVQVFKFGQPGSRDDVLGLARTVLSRV